VKPGLNTYDDKRYKVSPIPERVSILDVVHNVYPSGQADHLGTRRKIPTILFFE